MDLRRLRTFAAVADEGYVTRAASGLHLSQSAVSQQVAALERELGAVLFERTRNGVRLTPAGRVLRERADGVFAAVQTAVADTLRASSPVTGRLRVGVSSFGVPDHPARMLARLALLAPGLEVTQLPSDSTAGRMAAVRSGELDAAVVRLTHLADDELGYTRLVEESMVLAVRAGDPLTARPPVSLAEVARRPMAFYSREQNPLWFDDVMARLSRDGATPVVVHTGTWVYDNLPVVAASNAVCPVTVSLAASIPYSGVSYVPIAEPGLRTGVGLVWRAADPSPAVAQLVEAAVLTRAERSGGP